MKEIIRILKIENDSAPILLFGLYNPVPESEEIEKQFDRWNNSIAELAKGNDRIYFINTNDLFKGKQKKEYFHDSLHPNHKGYKLIAERVLTKFEFK